MARVLLIALVLLLVPAGTATASVPPSKCGAMTVSGKGFLVRSHLVACVNARRHARHILRGGRGPRGWSCRRYSRRQTRIAFMCRRGQRDFYAVRR